MTAELMENVNVFYAVVVCIIVILCYVLWKNKHGVEGKTADAFIPELSNNILLHNGSRDDIIITTGVRSCKYTNLISCDTRRFGVNSECVSCDNPLARCVHFEAEHHTPDGGVIPPNKSLDEGYCLPVTSTLAERCHPNWGRYVIFETSDDQDDRITYGVACVCTSPSLITQQYVGGPCDVPTVCGGRIKTLDATTLECVCQSSDEMSVLKGSHPVCVPKTAQDLTYDHYPAPIIADTIDTYVYDDGVRHFAVVYTGPTVPKECLASKDRIKTAYVPNPCTVCPITGKSVRGGLLYDAKHAWARCVPADNYPHVTPWRVEPTKGRVLIGSHGPDCVLALSLNFISQYVYLKTHVREDNCVPLYGVFYRTAENSEFYDALQLDSSLAYRIKLNDNEALFPGGYQQEPLVVDVCAKMLTPVISKIPYDLTKYCVPIIMGDVDYAFSNFPLENNERGPINYRTAIRRIGHYIEPDGQSDFFPTSPTDSTHGDIYVAGCVKKTHTSITAAGHVFRLYPDKFKSHFSTEPCAVPGSGNIGSQFPTPPGNNPLSFYYITKSGQLGVVMNEGFISGEPHLKIYKIDFHPVISNDRVGGYFAVPFVSETTSAPNDSDIAVIDPPPADSVKLNAPLDL